MKAVFINSIKTSKKTVSDIEISKSILEFNPLISTPILLKRALEMCPNYGAGPGCLEIMNVQDTMKIEAVLIGKFTFDF